MRSSWAKDAVFWWAAWVVFASLFSTGANGFVAEEFSGGYCLQYPTSEEHWCSAVGMANTSVFVFGATSETDMAALEARSVALANFGGALEIAARQLAGAQCVNEFKFLACMTWFPPCDPDNVPIKPCKDGCEKVLTSCKLAFDVAATSGFGHAIPQCETATYFGDAEDTLIPFGIFSLPGTWAGSPVFETSSYNWDPYNTGQSKRYDCASIDGIDFTKNCNEPTCSEPMIRGRWPTMKDELKVSPGYKVPEDYEVCSDMSLEFDCGRCWSSCNMPCPYPLAFTEGEKKAQWVSQWLPGVVSIIFNGLVFFTETVKLRKMKKPGMSDRLIQISAGVALLLAFSDSVPSMFLSHDIRCDGLEVFDQWENIDGHDWCQFGQYRHWILISLMATVMINLYKVQGQLQAAITMKKSKTSTREKIGFIVAIFIIPALLALIAGATKPLVIKHASNTYRLYHAQDELAYRPDGTLENYRSLYAANNMRGQYACQFFFDTDTDEMMLYVVPLLLYSLGCTGISLNLLRLVKKMASGAASNEDKKKGGKAKKNEAIVRLARNMMRFAAVACTLAALNVVANMIFVPKAVQFGIDIESFVSCAGSGIKPRYWKGEEINDGIVTREPENINKNTSQEAVLNHCGDIREVSPSAALLVLLALSQSLPAFCFGVIFAIPALKQLRAVLKNKMSSVMPTSSSASSSESD